MAGTRVLCNALKLVGNALLSCTVVLITNNKTFESLSMSGSKVSSGQTGLRTRWRGVERKKKSENKREGEDPSISRFTSHYYILLI